jgi:hypothetical protein
MLTEPGRFLCVACRDVSQARQLEKRRVRERARCARIRRVRRKKPAVRALDSETVSSAGSAEYCAGAAEGGELFCGACREARQRVRYVDPLPPGPPTSMKWLTKFSGWAKSGLSYADYQAAEREKHHY